MNTVKNKSTATPIRHRKQAAPTKLHSQTAWDAVLYKVGTDIDEREMSDLITCD